MALHGNEAPEPQPLSCTCFPCSLEGGFALNTKVLSLLPKSCVGGTQPGLMAPSSEREFNAQVQHWLQHPPVWMCFPHIPLHGGCSSYQQTGSPEDQAGCAVLLSVHCREHHHPGDPLHTFTCAMFFSPQQPYYHI